MNFVGRNVNFCDSCYKIFVIYINAYDFYAYFTNLYVVQHIIFVVQSMNFVVQKVRRSKKTGQKCWKEEDYLGVCVGRIFSGERRVLETGGEVSTLYYNTDFGFV